MLQGLNGEKYKLNLVYLVSKNNKKCLKNNRTYQKTERLAERDSTAMLSSLKNNNKDRLQLTEYNLNECIHTNINKCETKYCLYVEWQLKHNVELMKIENPCLVAITVILDLGWVFDNKQDTGTVLDCFSIKHLSITKVKMGMQPWKNPGDISFTRWSKITKGG